MNNNNNSNTINANAELDRNIEQQEINRVLQENIENDKLSLVKYNNKSNNEDIKEIESEMSALDIEVDKINEYKRNNPNSSFENDGRDELIEPEVVEESFSSLFKLVKVISENLDKLESKILESTTPLSKILQEMSRGELNEKITKIINNVKEGLIEKKEIYKPLGTWGDMTLNEAFNEIRELNAPVVKDAIDVVINTGGIIPAGMLYGGVVKLYMRNVNPHSEIMKIVDLHERMKALRIRRRELLLVMVGVAPITASIILFFGKLSVAELIHVSVQSSDVTSLSSEFFGLGFMSQFFLNKKPNWFKYLLIILTIIFVFKSNIYLYILPYLTIQSLKYFWMFSLFNTIIYFSFNYIFVKIFYLNKKSIKIPNNLPRFIINQLEELKFISSSSLYIREKKRYKLFIIVSLILFIIAIPII